MKAQHHTTRTIAEQIALLLFSFGLAWCALALFNFGYSLWFDLLDIESFIATMAPQNYHKVGFEGLGKQTYVQLFKDINFAIHFAPHTLETLQYPVTLNGTSISIPLLREPEVIHLEDVSKFLSVLKIITIFSFFLLIYLVKTTHSSSKSRTFRPMAITWLCLILTSILIATTKPVAFFYWLHDAFFPAENQWFFYYQDSLMTTLMKAPILFGPISAALLLVTLMIGATINFFLIYKSSEK